MLASQTTEAQDQEQYPKLGRPLTIEQLPDKEIFYSIGSPGIPGKENEGNTSNAGFVVTDDGVVVFDALGTPALGQAMMLAIRKVTPAPIRRIIISHYHADHIYGLQALKSTGAEIWAHVKAKAYFTSGVAEARLAQRRVDLAPWVDET